VTNEDTVSTPSAARARPASIRFLTLLVLTGFVAVSCNNSESPTAPDTQTFGVTSGTFSSDILVSDGSYIDIEKSTNGFQADEPLGPQIPIGGTVTWTYVVMNNGSLPLQGINVTDDQVGAINCPHTTLSSGHLMTCTAQGIAQEGQYRNVATATGSTPQGVTAVDADASHYFGVTPGVASIDIEKATNGEDADEEIGPEIVVDDPVQWTYVVTNTGDVDLEQIAVTDDQLGDITCPADTLAAGATMICTAEGVAVEGQYVNVGTVVAQTSDAQEATDSDTSHYLGVLFEEEPEIDIEKSTNGFDADRPTGPRIPVGSTVTWTYVVTNTGNVDLNSVAVTDDQIGDISCPKDTLAVGESMTCSADGTVIEGQYANLGTATGTSPEDTVVEDTDPSHYLGFEETPGVSGCSQGYWKNHLGSWSATGFSPSDTVGSIFASAAAYPSVAANTLLGALDAGGGPNLEDAAALLMKQAVAALLNAAHPSVPHPRSIAAVIGDVNSALDSGSRSTMLALKDQLDRDNNLGCPID